MKTNWQYWIASMTDSCNNRCPGCYRVLQNNLSCQNGHMAMNDFEKILAMFVSEGGVSVDFVGGEPTLHPQFLEMAEKCAKAGVDVWVYTNLRTFGKNQELARRLLEIGGDKVIVVGKLNVPDLNDPAQAEFQAELIGSDRQAVDEMRRGLNSLLAAGFPKGKIGVENLLRKANINIIGQSKKEHAMNPLDRIGVLVLVDPALGITSENAKAALDACLEFNGDGLPLSRVCVTGQATTSTLWLELLDFIQYAAVEKKQKSAVRVFSDLQGMTEDKAREIRNLGAWLFGEWFAPSLNQRGVKIMTQQGMSMDKAEAMLKGILNSLKAKALTGIEFQINKNNFQYTGEFIKVCRELGIEAHLEMQEIKFTRRRQKDLADLRLKYLDLLPPKNELLKIARLVRADIPLSPFFCSGISRLQYGVCNYWFENGLFIRSNRRGGLLRSACLSDATPIDADFVPTIERLRRNLEHPLVAMRQTLRQSDMIGSKCANCSFWGYCRGGCRAMAFLASNDDFSPDPNCWYGYKDR